MTDSQEPFFVVLGTNGTGKSSIVEGLIEQYNQRGGRALIVMPDDAEWQDYDSIDFENPKEIRNFTGIKTTIFDEDYTTNNIVKYYSHGMLIFDDCMSYFDSGVPKPLHRVLIRRRQYHLNTVAVGHGFTEIPPKFLTFATHFILFLTLDSILSKKKYFKPQEYLSLLKYQEKINDKANKNLHYCEIIKRKDLR